MDIRPYTPADWPAVWAMLRAVFRAGETYAVARDITEAEARHMWVDAPTATFVARDADGHINGTYYLKPNQAGPGAHVCNCGYIVAKAARGRGVARAMCAHSQTVAIEHGFRAMQYNLVVATNTAAIGLWRKMGFAIVGTLPGAFDHPEDGLVDAYVMFKTLRGQDPDGSSQIPLS